MQRMEIEELVLYFQSMAQLLVPCIEHTVHITGSLVPPQDHFVDAATHLLQPLQAAFQAALQWPKYRYALSD